MLGHRFSALECLFAFLATVLVGWHGVLLHKTECYSNLHSTDRARAPKRKCAGPVCSRAGDRLHGKQIVSLNVVRCDTRKRR